MGDSVVKSAGRVFDVLELFAVKRHALTAVAIARDLKYPASSNSALLKSMVERGYLSFDPAERTYFPTIRLVMMTHWLEDSYFVEGHLIELMQEISTATGESVFVAWQNDLYMQFMRGKVGAKEFQMPAIDPRIPLFESVSGLTALTLKRDVEIAELAQRLNAERPSGNKVDLPAAITRINEFRALGYGVGYDFYIKDTSVVAWAFRPRGSSRSVVLSIYGPTKRFKAETKAIVTASRDAIRRYTAQT
jgi:IclR family transcriptional regulator, KDG regulon repressor